MPAVKLPTFNCTRSAPAANCNSGSWVVRPSKSVTMSLPFSGAVLLSNRKKIFPELGLGKMEILDVIPLVASQEEDVCFTTTVFSVTLEQPFDVTMTRTTL